MHFEKLEYSKRSGYLAFALIFLIATFASLFEPQLVRPSGTRWAPFFAWIWDTFGPWGITFYWGLWSSSLFILYWREIK